MSRLFPSQSDLETLQTAWRAQWSAALAVWSRYLQLSEPKWCFTPDDERREQLSGSFAMIRLLDHSVVISLRQIHQRSLEKFALEILAHEIGHHVYTPADLTDNARVLTRIRAGLPTQEASAPMIANLYEDLLINDRLQRSSALNMAGVYRQIDSQSTDRLWTLYMRIYEMLWSLPKQSLAHGRLDERLETDAQLGTRLIRSYAKDWLDGAGRFAVLCLPYLAESDLNKLKGVVQPWQDTPTCGDGGFPDGLTEIEAEEIEGAVHPAEDPELSGLEPGAGDVRSKPVDVDSLHGSTMVGGQKSLKKYREPFEYAAVMRAAGVTLDEAQLTIRYYRERALAYLVKFPTRPSPQAVDPLLEGLELWDLGSNVDEIDWLGTLQASPVVVPGVTTRERRVGESPGTTPQRAPIDLYLGVDCSGSMLNPALSVSYPVLAGAVMALSALRTGSRVMAALSGEPGRTVTTDGFIRDESLILGMLTGYLGTGTTFGIHRLADTFAARSATDRPVHILIITDGDIFSMLQQTNKNAQGWEVARRCVAQARGGGTYVLHLPPSSRGRWTSEMQRMQEDGWQTPCVDSMEELVEFARRFSQAHYGT